MSDFDSLIPDQPDKFDDLKADENPYSTPTDIAKTAVEQGLSGATLGVSKVIETQGIPALGVPPYTTPEALEGRARANPGTAFVSNVIGTGGMLLGTGGLGGIAEGAGIAGRIGLGALEGAGIGSINQITDDWSQNKPLDAQRIAVSGGIGALLGTAGGLVGEGIAAISARRAANRAAKLELGTNASSEGIEGGVQGTSFQDIAERVRNSDNPLPQQAELDSALSRTPLENPVNPLQRESLANKEANEIYQTGKETPGEVGSVLSDYEGLQKRELTQKTAETIASVSPTKAPLEDAFQGGKQAIDAFTEQYQAEQKALAPIFRDLKTLPVEGDLLPEAVARMSEALPGVSEMFDTSFADIAIKPYKTAWGIDKATYNAVKQVVESLKGEANTLETLWNVRKGLDQHVDVLAKGQAPSEIRTLKAALMNLMQDASGNPEIREAFKRYAINEQQRQVIESAFGASVGSAEFGQISKVKPELIGDRIFGNTATVQAAKNILPPEQFQKVLANWLSEAKAAATDKGVFSSNKFGSFLRRNQDALNVAFQENPAVLQRIKDLNIISRILPDAASVNPSGTAKTLTRMLFGPNFKVHNLTKEGLIATLPKYVLDQFAKRQKMKQLNQYLSGVAIKNAQQLELKKQSAEQSDRISQAVKTIFSSSASESREANGKRTK